MMKHAPTIQWRSSAPGAGPGATRPDVAVSQGHDDAIRAGEGVGKIVIKVGREP